MSLFGGNTPKRTRLRLLDIFPKGTLGAGHEPTTIGDGTDIPLVIASPSAQSVDLIQVQTAAATPVPIFRVDQNGNVFGNSVSNVPLQQVAQFTLTAANIEAMYATPVTILPAPSSNQLILVDQIVAQTKPGGTAFTAGGAVTLEYHGTAVNPTPATLLTAAQVQSATQILVSLGPATQTALALVTALGLGVDVTNATQAFATGNGTIVLTVFYTTLTLS